MTAAPKATISIHFQNSDWNFSYDTNNIDRATVAPFLSAIASYGFFRTMSLTKDLILKASPEQFNAKRIESVFNALSSFAEAKNKHKIVQQQFNSRDPEDWLTLEGDQESLAKANEELSKARSTFETAKRDAAIEVILDSDENQT